MEVAVSESTGLRAEAKHVTERKLTRTYMYDTSLERCSRADQNGVYIVLLSCAVAELAGIFHPEKAAASRNFPMGFNTGIFRGATKCTNSLVMFATMRGFCRAR